MGKKLEELKNTILQQKRVIVYGAGNNAGPLITWLDENEEFKSIDKYVAVTKPKQDEIFMGHKVKCIDELAKYRLDSLVIVATFHSFTEDMCKRLQYLEFQNYIILGDWFVDEAYYEPLEKEPINSKKILVENFHGLGYGDSPKYIVEEILKYRHDLDIVWVVKAGVQANVPQGIRTVEMYSYQFFYEVVTSKIWISNVRKYQSVKKKKEQFYIQTWHGFALKRIEKDAEEISRGISAPYFDAGKKDSQMINLLISNASFMTQIYKNGFWYDGEIWEIGLPRNDIFFKKQNEYGKVRHFYDISMEYNILLYAPTFRNNYGENPLDICIEEVLDKLEKKTKSSWVALIRMHPNIVNKASTFSYSKRILDATKYQDVMELLNEADALITDYSSIMFDFMIKEKPIFLYAKDLRRYENKDRGFYFEYDELPFPKAVSKEELIENINNYDEQKYLKMMRLFKKKMGFCDKGNASEIIANKILNIVK